MPTDGHGQTSTAKLLGEVHSSIIDLATMLNSARSATSEYGQSLNHFTSHIPGNSNEEDFNAIVMGIITATGKMAERNLELESQLDRATSKVHELGEYLETAKQEAMTDGLTGLANRRAFDKQILVNTEEATTHKSSLSLLLIDIDHFKKFNDTYGHLVGDQVLRLVSNVLLSNIKGRDMGARYGGEEFAILLPRTPLTGGLQVAELLRRVVENKELVDKLKDQKLGRITLSIGVAQYVPGEGVGSFIKRADTALYEAKKSGRNRVFAG